jgi:hypothetical protein
MSAYLDSLFISAFLILISFLPKYKETEMGVGVGPSALFLFIFIPRKDYWVGVCVGNKLVRGKGLQWICGPVQMVRLRFFRCRDLSYSKVNFFNSDKVY